MNNPQCDSGQTFEGGSPSGSENLSGHCLYLSSVDSNSSDDDGDDMPDVGWVMSGQARQAHPGMYLSELSQNTY